VRNTCIIGKHSIHHGFSLRKLLGSTIRVHDPKTIDELFGKRIQSMARDTSESKRQRNNSVELNMVVKHRL